jgi:amidohydrolase
MSIIKEKTEECIDEIVGIRRQIHKHPEIGRNEFVTSALIRQKLEEYGVDKIESPVPTAVVALIHGNKGEGRCVALRCDIDALPVQEDTGLPFSSEVPNMMHACGHDMHASMLLGVAKLLCQLRDEFPGTVKLVFQHSEDTLPGGAKELVEKGVMENPHVDAIFGMHVMPDEGIIGKIGVRKGPMTSSVDLYDITVNGVGGHGSEPHKTTDPVLAAAQMIVAMQQIVARRVDPLETAVVSIGTLHADGAVNVIPSQVKFAGVSRAYGEETRETIRKQMFDIAKGMESISGCEFDVYHYYGYPTAINDDELVDLASEAITQELGDDSIIELEKPMGFSEDFAYYRQMAGVPSAFFMLYAGHEGDTLYSLHNPKCAVKEEAMPYGIRTMTSIAIKYLNSK